jgi:enoyl-CoA hydratase/carnithine racemase
MMPWAIASELLLLADRVDAERAREVGIVNRVVAQDELMAEADKVAQRFCELSPRAVQGMKESMVRGSALDYAALDHITNLVQTRVMNSEDRKMGGQVFNDRGTVDWPD